ncbi:hypothetical protein HZS_3300 [Henneguya salminicola]|nr:hypothetical protein HZS_3300 [Henneguya salminicola]
MLPFYEILMLGYFGISHKYILRVMECPENNKLFLGTGQLLLRKEEMSLKIFLTITWGSLKGDENTQQIF